MAYLNLKNASYGYNKSFRLSGISFSISKGDFCGIIGPNGSGKSTLLKGISGELSIPKGEVFIDGIDISGMTSKERARKIAVVTQFSEPLDLSVEEYVLSGRIPYRNKYQFFETDDDYIIANKYMKLTDVHHLRNKKFNQLSGGEQQLVSVAKALIQEPSLLLLDEPTSHLDITHQVQILNLIQLLNEELGLTVLMVIHDLNLASEYCDHLVLMNKGELFKYGTPDDILNYQNIEAVYNTMVVTQENPLSKKPSIFLVSKKLLTASEDIKQK